MNELKWYYYSQNNSGGYFINNDDVAHGIFVEAASSKDANAKAFEITSEYLEFCDCCGERWWIDASDEDGTEVPEVYGVSIYESKAGAFRDRYILYYASGDKKSVDQSK